VEIELNRPEKVNPMFARTLMKQTSFATTSTGVRAYGYFHQEHPVMKPAAPAKELASSSRWRVGLELKELASSSRWRVGLELSGLEFGTHLGWEFYWFWTANTGVAETI
jgi:hypothetical protein